MFPWLKKSKSDASLTKSQWPIIFLLSLLIWIIGIVTITLPPNWNIERQVGLHLLFNLRGTEAPPGNVIVVAINRESAKALEQTARPDNWDRAIHAQLIDELITLGAQSITFDVLFSPRKQAVSLETSTCQSKDGDFELANSIEAAGNVTLFMDLETDVKAHQNKGLRVEKVHTPAPCISNATRAMAPFVLPKIPNRVDQFWLFKPGAGNQPSLPVMSLGVYTRDTWTTFCKLLSTASQTLPTPQTFNCPTLQQSPSELLESFSQTHQLFRAHPRLHAILVSTLEDQDEYADELRMLLELFSNPQDPLINYYGPAETITTYSYADFIGPNKRAKSPNLKNTAVFIGVSELQSSQTDAFQTVFRDTKNGFDISGVEIAATAFARLRDSENIYPIAWGYNLLILLCFSILTSVLFIKASPKLIIASLFIIPTLYIALAYSLFIQYSLWISFIVPLLVQIPISLIITFFWRFIQSRKEEQKVVTALRQLLPETVIDAIMKGTDLTVEGTTLEGVCLFSDASQYTALSETMEPEPLRRFLNRYFSNLIEPVESHKGFVSDIIGDAMMAIWSDLKPSTSSNHAMREATCLTALEIIENIHRFNIGYPEHQLPTRMGIHTGEISLGNVGAHGHYEYRAVGDTVNIASRLEGLNKKCGTWILASKQTVEGLDSIISRYAGSFHLKGKTKPIEVYEIMATQADADDALIQRKTQFEHALSIFAQHQYSDAKTLFQTITETTPQDSLAQYYYQQCTVMELKCKEH